MGPINSAESKVKQQEFISNYQIIQSIQSQRIRFLQHKQTKKQYLLRQLTYDNDKMYQQALQNIRNKKQQLKNAEHITAITQFFSKKVDTYCSDFYKIYVLFQYPQRTLDDQINERNLRKNNFSQTQIWSILASCILGLGHLQKKGIRHSSLKSSMIFLSQQGFIKISDPFTTGCQTNYQTLLNKRGSKHIYLSPQLCQSLQNQVISPVINTYKSDIFTLGMIILECGLLQYQDQCYRDECSRIHWETLEYNKNRFRRAYSEELANMLEYMLGAEANNRPEWIELENYVITDNTGSKSLISQGRKSALIGYSKPVSVNINKLLVEGSQTKIITAQKPVQKNVAPNNIIPTTINRGLRVSSSKPQSIVQKLQSIPILQGKRQQMVTQFRPSTLSQTHTTSNQKPSHVISNIPTQKNHPLPPTFISPSQPNKSFISQSPIKQSHLIHTNINMNTTNTNNNIINNPNSININSSNIINNNMNSNLFIKRYDLRPLNPSNINMTRPFKSIFPNPFYQTVTKADQNLIQLDDDQQTSRAVSESQSIQNHKNIINNYQYMNKNNQISRQQQQQYNVININNNNNINSNNSNSNSKIYQQQKQIATQFTHKINNNNTNLSTTTNKFYSTSSQSYNQINKFQQQKFPLSNNINSLPQQGQFVIQTFKLGSRYEGYKLNGMRHGAGKFFYQDGGMYDGNWVRNKMQGYGKLYYQSGKLAYQGQWIQDQFKGHGILYNQNPDTLNHMFNYQNFDDVQQLWTKYQGYFDDDSKNGKGILYLSNGQYFQGNFVNDTAEGQGIFIMLNGNKIHGIWDNNRLVKEL